MRRIRSTCGRATTVWQTAHVTKKPLDIVVGKKITHYLLTSAPILGNPDIVLSLISKHYI